MKKRNLICGVVLILSVAVTTLVEGQDNFTEPAVESIHTDNALKILTGAAQFIEAAPAFSAKGSVVGDLQLENGQLVEHGSTFTVIFSRPTKLYLNLNSRKGDETTMVFDGETITIASSKDGRHFFDTTSQPGDINESLDFMASQIGSPRELNYILSEELTKSLNRVQSGIPLGKSTIDGVLCDHVAVRTDTKDKQVWIERGDEPAPRRILITHRDKPGQPRFRVQFDEWEFAAEISSSTFTYTPPVGAVRFEYLSD